MKRWSLILALAAAFPAAASAQDAPFSSTVRSGEHGEFTRLVFRAPENAQWTSRKSGSTMIVAFGATEFNFDLSQVFQRIDTERLTSVRPTEANNGLQLNLACECDLDIFQNSLSYVVIDIREGGAQENSFSLDTRLLPYRFQDRIQSDTPYTFGIDPVELTESETDLGIVEDEIPENLEKDLAGALIDQAGSLDLPLTVTPEDQSDELDRLENILLGQVGHAAGQGLVETTRELSVDQTLSNDEAPLGENFSIVTSVDREVRKLGPDVSLKPSEQQCRKIADLDVAKWKDEQDISTRIGELRSEIFGEFDKIDETALRRLAKTYLYYGFGAEAKQTLMMVSQPKPNQKYLLALADVLDDVSNTSDTAYAGLHHCESSAALWSVLAMEDVLDGTDKEALLRAFSGLPAHLRTHLGPRLSTLFAEAGDQATAEAILRAVARTGVTESPGLNMAEAEIAALKDDQATVQKKLVETVVSNELNSAEALVKLVEEHWKTQQPLAPDVPELAAGFAVEFRGDALGVDLRRAEVVALSMTGNFTEAFERIQEIRTVDGRGPETEAMERFLIALSSYSDDVTFLEFVLGPSETEAFPTDPEASVPVAQRLLELGFPGKARDIVERMQAGRTLNEESELLLARSAVALELPHRALIDLLGNSSAEADRVRAKAMFHSGAFEEAAQLSLQVEDLEGAWRGSWHAGQALKEVEKTDGKYPELAALSDQIENASQSPAEVTPLAQARALVEGSAEIRHSIEALRLQSQQ